MSARKTCLIHDIDLLPLICKCCGVVVCPQCVERNHEGHKLTAVSTVARFHREQLEQSLLRPENISSVTVAASTVQRSLELVSEHSCKIEKDINEQACRLIKEIEEHRLAHLDRNHVLKEKYETPLKQISRRMLQFVKNSDSAEKEKVDIEIEILSDQDVVVMNLDFQHILRKDDSELQFSPLSYSYSVNKDVSGDLLGSFIDEELALSDFDCESLDDVKSNKDTFQDCKGYPLKLERRAIFDGYVDSLIPRSAGSVLILSGDKLYEILDTVSSALQCVEVTRGIKQLRRTKSGRIFLHRILSKKTNRVEQLLPDNRVALFCIIESNGEHLCIGEDIDGDLAVGLASDWNRTKIFYFDKSGKTKKDPEIFRELGYGITNTITSSEGNTFISYTHRIDCYDKSLKKLSTFKGAIGVGFDRRFHPECMCMDFRGNILVAIQAEHSIHLLDQEGRFVRLLLTEEDGVRYPVSLAFDNSGNLWIGSSDGNVIVVEYDIIYFSSR